MIFSVSVLRLISAGSDQDDGGFTPNLWTVNSCRPLTGFSQDFVHHHDHDLVNFLEGLPELAC